MTRSIQNPNTNSVSTQIVEVPTSTGFNAGDLVYFKGSTNDYVPPSGIVPSSANFTNAIVPISLNGTAGSTLSVASPLGTLTGGGMRNSMAVLTNGNIVQVWSDITSTQPYFTILDNTLSTVVVAKTSITATYPMSGTWCISVVALTGGGFAVAWLCSSGGAGVYPCYAIYTNAGAVTTAATQDSAAGTPSTVGLQYALLQVTALANGGFAISYTDNTATVIFTRAYGSTGTAAYTWKSITSDSTQSYGWGMAATSSSYVIVASKTSTTNTWQYIMYSTTGTVAVALTTFTSPTGTGQSLAIDVTVLADGTTAVFAYGNSISSNNQLAYRICPTTTSSITLGSEFLIPIANVGNGSYPMNAQTPLSVMALSFGGFIIFGCIISTYAYANGYAVFNSAGACVSGLGPTSSNAAGWHEIPELNWYQGQYGLVEIPSLSTAYILAPAQAYSTANPYNQYVLKLSTATYSPTYSLSLTQTTGTVSATPSAANLSAFAPTSGSFYGSGGASRITPTPGTIVKDATVIDSVTTASIYAMSSTTFPNGNFAIGYFNSTSTIVINTYTSTGNLVQSFNTGITGRNAYVNTSSIRITALTSGKLALIYADPVTTTQAKIVLYSSVFVQIGTTQTLTDFVASFSGFGIGMCSLTNDRFAVTYSKNGSAGAAVIYVYDNTGGTYVYTVLSALSAAQQLYGIQIAGQPDGGFCVMAYSNNDSALKANWFRNTTGNTFVNQSVYSVWTSTGGNFWAGSIGASQNGIIYYPVQDTTAGVGTYLYATNYKNSGNSAISPAISLATYGTNANTYMRFCTGTTGYGTPVIFIWKTSATLSVLGAAASLTSMSPTIIDTSIGLANANLQLSVTPGAGYNVVVAFTNVNDKPSFAILNVPPKNVTDWVPTSTTSASAATSINPITSTTSGAINNTLLAGVAATTAAAGTAGQLVINGPAQLNSSYSATNTGSFDYSGQGVSGVKGTYNGRNINLQGNS